MLPFLELKQTPPHTPCPSPPTPTPRSSRPLLTTHSLFPVLYHLLSDPSPAPETPEGRSPSLPTLPSKKPREGVVPPETGKPFILGASLLTDSCVDWKFGCALYGPWLLQPCGPSAPDQPSLLLDPLHPNPATCPNGPIAAHFPPPTHSERLFWSSYWPKTTLLLVAN